MAPGVTHLKVQAVFRNRNCAARSLHAVELHLSVGIGSSCARYGCYSSDCRRSWIVGTAELGAFLRLHTPTTAPVPNQLRRVVRCRSSFPAASFRQRHTNRRTWCMAVNSAAWECVCCCRNRYSRYRSAFMARISSFLPSRTTASSDVFVTNRSFMCSEGLTAASQIVS